MPQKVIIVDELGAFVEQENPQEVTQVDELGASINAQNPLDVGGTASELISEVLRQILDEARLTNKLLMEMGK